MMQVDMHAGIAFAMRSLCPPPYPSPLYLEVESPEEEERVSVGT